ncbi:hypothetical protein F4818DRAFT_441461 [Hypoxylon cercidicola]|nr:hypothetical protein F4818DRAFT_441461 [Hypoxylon cercidicola]
MSSTRTTSTYQRYKDDTQLFITWITKTATACGWKPTAPKKAAQGTSQANPDKGKGRLKDKERKSAKNVNSVKEDTEKANPNAVQTITTQQLLDQVDIVAKSNRTSNHMPQNIHQALYNAIALRKQCVAWFEKTDSATPAAMEGHQYFIGVLERAIHELHNESDDSSGGNPFLLLEVEDIPEEMSSTVQPNYVYRAAQTNEEDTECQLETDPQIDIVMIAYSLFRDRRLLRAEVKRVWMRVDHGNMDLAQATILALACLEMVRQAEIGAYERYDSVEKQSDQTYRDFCSMIGTADSDSEFKGTERILSKLAQCLKGGISTSLTERYIPRTGAESLHDPEMRRFEEQDKFICQVILDMIIDYKRRRACVDKASSDYTLQFEDSVYTTLRELWTTNIVTPTMVFAAQMLWDIHNISSKAASGPTVMKSAADKYCNSFDFSLTYGSAVSMKGLRTTEKNSVLIYNIYGFTTKIFDDGASFPRFKQLSLKLSTLAKLHIEDGKSRDADDYITTNEENYFLMKANPFYAGTFVIDLGSTVEEAGVELANCHVSIFLVSHLYNLLHQSGLCSIRWTVLERVIELHSKAIFGDKIPLSIEEMVLRFDYRAGIPHDEKQRIFRPDHWRMQLTPAAQALREFLKSTRTLPQLMSTLDSQAAVHEVSPYRGNKISKAQQGAKRHQPRHLTPVETLSKLEEHLEAIFPDIEIDYVGLTRQCIRLLSRIREETDAVVPTKYPDLGGSEDQDVKERDFNTLAVYDLIQEAKDLQENAPRKKDGRKKTMAEVLVNGPRIRTARKVLIKELSGENS